MKNGNNKGFTLIELSVALVIISLVVGGVFMGRDLITSAQIRATARQLEMFNTSYTAFLLKYNCLPGDCGNAAEFGFTPMVVTISDATPLAPFSIYDNISLISNAHADGDMEDISMPGGGPLQVNPNGSHPLLFACGICTNTISAPPQIINVPVVGSNNFIVDTPEESLGGHVTLNEANMISIDVLRGSVPIKLDVTSPLNGQKAFVLLFDVSPVAGSLADAAGRYYTITATAIPGNTAAATFTASNAFQLDTKTDDGFPLTGNTRSTGSSIFPTTITNGMSFDVNVDAGAGKCINMIDGKLQYNVSVDRPSDNNSLCTPVVRAAI